MTKTTQHIWYASYGSNLLEERFLCYIKGGRPVGSTKTYPGCEDKTLPTRNEEIYINSELYFAKHSKAWDGGVAFISTEFDPSVSTLGRMYLITKDQFIDVLRQETGTRTDLTIDFQQAIKNGSVIVKEGSWYGNVVGLGTHDGSPIFTFTNEAPFQKPTKPGERYLNTMVKGIHEIYNLTPNEICEYLISKPGIKGNYTSAELLRVVTEAS